MEVPQIEVVDVTNLVPRAKRAGCGEDSAKNRSQYMGAHHPVAPNAAGVGQPDVEHVRTCESLRRPLLIEKTWLEKKTLSGQSSSGVFSIRHKLTARHQ